MSSISPEWAPSEPRAALLSERLGLAGVFIGASAFGITFTLFVWCCRLIYGKKTKSRNDWFKLVYTLIIFSLSCIGNAAYIKFVQMSWIDNRNYPGGPGAFFSREDAFTDPALGNGALIIATWFQDGLLLYRLWVIYSGNWFVVTLPLLMFIASVILSILFYIAILRPGIGIHAHISVSLGTPYWALSFASNVFITVFIAGRLLHMRHRLRKVTGLDGSDYLSITAVLVESATLYTLNGIVFIVPFALNSPVQGLWLPVLGQTQTIAPLLVILRSLMGTTWTSSTAAELGAAGSTIHFRGLSNDTGGNGQTQTVLEVFTTSKSEKFEGSSDANKAEV